MIIWWNKQIDRMYCHIYGELAKHVLFIINEFDACDFGTINYRIAILKRLWIEFKLSILESLVIGDMP